MALPQHSVQYTKGSWWKRFWVAVDYLVNVFFSWPLTKVTGLVNHFGWDGETVSSVLGKNLHRGCWFCDRMCAFLSRFGVFGANHCERSVEPDRGLTPPDWWWAWKARQEGENDD